MAGRSLACRDDDAHDDDHDFYGDAHGDRGVRYDHDALLIPSWLSYGPSYDDGNDGRKEYEALGDGGDDDDVLSLVCGGDGE